MDFFDLVNISERFMELVNPASPEKILRFGEHLGLRDGMRVIDFGCGFAEPLVLWAEEFGIQGIGIDIRPYACERARAKITSRGLGGRLEIVCMDAAKYEFPTRSFDVAACLGATFIWGGFEGALRAMRSAIVPHGMLGVGEVYWLQETIPTKYQQRPEDTLREIDLLRLARQAGLTVAGIVRASHDDWDRYQSDNWRGLLVWLAENPSHPERGEVVAHLQQTQEEYLQYGRQYLGWAMYALQNLKA
jgi:SAM-dependent methyltransferase